MAVTIFSWGYWGWGGAAAEFVRAVDAIEASRGYAAPTFVDIRIRRTGRAAGFKGVAFQASIGPERHRWMRSLGNRLAGDPHGLVDIVDPAAAGDLLDLALECNRTRRRVLFFCACEFPGSEGQDHSCHRSTVSRLVLEAARKRATRIDIAEWPGGEAFLEGLDLTVSAPVFKQLAAGRKSVPLDGFERARVDHMASVPWGSVASVRCDERAEPEPLRLMTGPARCRAKDGWFLPVFQTINPSAAASAPLLVAEWRRAKGIVNQVSHG